MVAESSACEGRGDGEGADGTTECNPDPPAWDGMPAPRAVMTLSWEEVWFKLCNDLGRQPTKEEVKTTFEEAARRMEDVLIEDFWVCLDSVVEEYTGRKASFHYRLV